MFQFELLTKRDWALVVVFTVALALILGGAFYWALHSVVPPTKALMRTESKSSTAIECSEGFALDKTASPCGGGGGYALPKDPTPFARSGRSDPDLAVDLVRLRLVEPDQLGRDDEVLRRQPEAVGM